MIKPFGMDPGEEYAAFIASPQWAQIRQAVIDRDGGKCQICGCQNGLQAHHMRYQDDKGNRDWKNTKNIVCLCVRCHHIIHDAVDRAKTMTVSVPAFQARPYMGMTMEETMARKLWHAQYGASAELVSDTMLELFKRTLSEDAEQINMRHLPVLREIGSIVITTLQNLAGLSSGYENTGVAYAERTITKITNYIASAYNHYREEGFTDRDCQRMLRMTDSQMIKVRKNAGRLLRSGADGCG